jgi:hypothetical protein
MTRRDTNKITENIGHGRFSLEAEAIKFKIISTILTKIDI